MNIVHKPKTTNSVVSKLINSGAIARICCLGVGYFASHARHPELISTSLGKEVKAFQNFKVFQAAAEIAVALGRQSGGWLRRMRPEASIR